MSDGHPVTIGVIGSIGSGKSQVARFLGELGARVIDADQVARRQLESAFVKAKLRERYGSAVLQPDGGVDRAFLADRVFHDAQALEALEALIHPQVRQVFEAELEAARKASPPPPAVVFDVPLPEKLELPRFCSLIVYVAVPLETRLQRVKDHRSWSREELLRRQQHQLGPEELEAMATHVIPNDGTLEELRERVEALWRDHVA